MSRPGKRVSRLWALVIVVTALVSRTAMAVEYWLCANWTVKSLSEEDGDIVWIWGFAQSESEFTDDCQGEVTSPGPMLTIPEGDDALIVHLDNRLPYIKGEPVAVSLVIPGAPSNSDVAVALPGEPAIYIWKGLESGTYIYRSGVHPDIQVPMGLYGGITRDSGSGYAYPDYAYDHEAVLYYSEIDPTLNWIVLFGGYDPRSGEIGSYKYNPRYVLVNGESSSQYLGSFSASGAGQTTLLRFLNVGTTTYLPVILWSHMDVIAENAAPYPTPTRRYAVSLEPGSTKDALFTNDPVELLEFLDALFGSDEEDMPVDDVYTYLVADEDTPGPHAGRESTDPADEDIPGPHAGRESTEPADEDIPGPHVGRDSTEPEDDDAVSSFRDKTAVEDTYRVRQGSRLVLQAPGILENDLGYVDDVLTVELVEGPQHGQLKLDDSGGFVYSPDADFVGRDSFVYGLSNVTGGTTTATVTLRVYCQACEDGGEDGPWLTLSWESNPDDVLGYITYYGSSQAAVRLELSDLSAASDLDPESPSITYSMGELGVERGEEVCFWVRAYGDETMSDISEPVCATL